jgi:hypothetical protein
VKYCLTGVANNVKSEVVKLTLSGENEVTGEAIYRLLKTYWENPWDVMLNVTSSKTGKLTISRSAHTPSEAQKQTAKAIANQEK